jgi:hypothetical protein
VVALVVEDITEVVSLFFGVCYKCDNECGVGHYRGCSGGFVGSYRGGTVVVEKITGMVSVVV